MSSLEPREVKPVVVRVLYFAALRELVGVSEERLELPVDTRSILRLASVLSRRHPALEAYLDSVRFAVNEVFVATSAPLADGDVVALIPPVSGG